METKELLKKYQETLKELDVYNTASFIVSFDAMTDCPKKDKAHLMDVCDHFEKVVTDKILSDDYKNMIKELYGRRNELDEVVRLSIEAEYRDIVKLEKVPSEELYAHIEQVSRCGLRWDEAKNSKDHNFDEFEKELEALVTYYKKYIKWQESDTLKGYDILIDEMERGYNEKKFDAFFDVIEKELVPFVKEVLKKPLPYNPKLDNLKFDISKQKELTKKITSIMEYDNSVGCVRETTHPFTNWINCNDVRTTTRYDEKLLFSNLFSVIHETGHALYQIHMDPAFNGYRLFNEVTCISHESQSRFYENYLGRSKGFIHYLYPILKETYPEELKDITEKDIYNYVNAAKVQTIRCEADELTYALHVLIRYKVEKGLFHNEIEVKDIEKTFNYWMKEYLGITPKDKADGCYQDVHWSSDFGYFPTYAVGSAYGAQFIKALKKDVDVEKELSNGNFKNINAWLKKNIHFFGAKVQGDDLVEKVCGEKFDPINFVEYLKNKYSEIYDIK